MSKIPTESEAKKFYTISTMRAFLKRSNLIDEQNRKKLWKKTAIFFLLNFLTNDELKAFLITMNYYHMPKYILAIRDKTKFKRKLKDYRK